MRHSGRQKADGRESDMVNLGSRIVNHWIYPVENGYVLIDTGYENGFAHFKKKLAKINIDLQQIRYIFLTHAHDDHAGYLNELLSECDDVQIVMSSKALEGLYRGQNSFCGGCTTKLALCFCIFMKFVGKGRHLFPKLRQEYQGRCIQVHEQNRSQVEILLQGRIIETPGHTADSISLLRNDGSLFCGDAAMNGLPSLHRITIWAEDKTAYLKSWETIIALRPKIIYPGHGRPFGYGELIANKNRAKNMKLLPLRSKRFANKGYGAGKTDNTI